MYISEVRIKLMEDPGERLKAFCSITFDNCFVVRDLKIIDGSNGPFVAMPSRKLTSHCARCGMKNHLRAQYCNQCGATLSHDHMPLDADGRAKLYADIAHPINSACREMIQDHVINEYYEEIDRSKLPGYVSRYDDVDVELGYESDVPQLPQKRETRIDRPHHQSTPHDSHQRPESRRHNDIETTSHSRPSTDNPSKQVEDTFGSGIFPE